jgi:hypothetical protein
MHVLGDAYQSYSRLPTCKPQVCEAKLSKLTVRTENKNALQLKGWLTPSLLWAESRQRKVIFWSAKETRRSVVGDGHAMSVTAQITEHILGASEGSFGIDHPVFSEQRSLPGSKDFGSSCVW